MAQVPTTVLEEELAATRMLLEGDGRKVLIVGIVLDGPTGVMAHAVSDDTTFGDGRFFAGCLVELSLFLKSRSGAV